MLEAIFKQLGFNPAELKAQIENAGKKFNQVIGHFDTKLNRIDARLDAIQKHLGMVNSSNEAQKDEPKSIQ